MSTTDDSYIVVKEDTKKSTASARQKWWHILDNYKIGIIPLPFFLLAGVLILLDCLNGKLPSDIVVMVATLAFFGFACGEFWQTSAGGGKTGCGSDLRHLYTFSDGALRPAAGRRGGFHGEIL